MDNIHYSNKEAYVHIGDYVTEYGISETKEVTIVTHEDHIVRQLLILACKLKGVENKDTDHTAFMLEQELFDMMQR